MKIGIFTAMQKEAVSFLKPNTPKIQVGGFAVYTLKLGKHDAYLCCPPTVGEIGAAAACQLLISQFHVDLILNFGVVGALNKSTTLLSTVYVSSVTHYGMDLSEVDDLPVGGYGCFDDVAVPCDQTLLDKALSVAKCPLVRCASADKFVDRPEEKTALNAQFGADICDMESAGILFACKFNNIPCLLVKCVSDSLSGGYSEYKQTVQSATNGFFQFAEKLAAALG